ncbi:MAG: DUF349 domain-containing protein [Gilvibacter sp.]
MSDPTQDTPKTDAAQAEAPENIEQTSPTEDPTASADSNVEAAETPQAESEATVVEQQEVTADAVDEKTDDQNDATQDEEQVESSDDTSQEDESEEEAEETVDYSALEMSALVDAFKELLQKGKVPAIKQKAESIREAFNEKFQEEFTTQKEAFLAEGGNIIDFHYSTPIKKAFNNVYFDYKEKLNNYYKNLKKDLQANLSKRLELIEELKGLLSLEENINSTYKHFKDIQDRWREAGPIQRDKYNTVWNTYHHHVENFYDFLHLNREFRDLDFKHNLDQKLKIIGRAEELAAQDNIQKAFRELQMLHKMWKEEIGPVAKEFRDEVWEKFSAATKIIHDRRHAFLKDQEKSLETNYLQKQEIVAGIVQLCASTKPTHQGWQHAIKNVQELRNRFFEVGKVPRSKNQEIWQSFKDATKEFNKHKNEYYKSQKKEQYANLSLKRDLVQTARDNKDSDDFEVTTPLMKKIQGDWKKIGHVPRKESDKIWKEFKQACNHYFDRLHATKNKANKEELEAFDKKKAFLDEFSSVELPKETDKAVDLLKEKIEAWKSIGRVPYNKKQIEGRFNKELDAMFGKLDLDKQEIELIKFENKMNQMLSQNDERKIHNERAFLSKKIDEVVQEINQLENNLGFFQHQDDKNPLVQDVHKNIKRHKDALEVWKAKLKKLKSMQ